MLSKEERLKIYKQMLKDYLKSFIYSKYDLHTEQGFCLYLMCMEGKTSVWDVNIMDDYPELWKQKPQKYCRGTLYWYRQGSLIPRIICLLKAINLCK